MHNKRLNQTSLTHIVLCVAFMLPSMQKAQGTITITPQTTSPVLMSYFDKSINEAGLLDQSFGTNGIVTGPPGRAYAIGIESDGTIITTSFDGAANFLTCAYSSRGSLLFSATAPAGIAYGLVLQPDGKPVAGGFSNPGGPGNFRVARYNLDGSLDTTFNTTGYTNTPAGGAYGITLQSDGKILGTGIDNAGHFCTVRYNSDGTLDDTFNHTGFVVGPVGSGNAVGIQSSGKIVVIGSSAGAVYLIRYKADGSLDTSFNGTGSVTGPVSSVFIGIVQPDGKILSVGDDGVHYQLIRFNSDGTLDNTFGTNGVALTTITGSPRGAGLQPDGKILVSGDDGASNAIRTLRFNIDGSLDTTFGVGGVTTVTLAGGYGWGTAVQKNGNIVVCGTLNANSALVRYINPYTISTFTEVYGGAGFL